MDRPGIPRPSLGRLPLYYRFLVQAGEAGRAVVSSDEMGQALGLPAAQIRKDLSYLRELGRRGVGYDVGVLLDGLREALGLGHQKGAIVVGAGHLGQALASYAGFSVYGMRIVALFDDDPAKIGMWVAGRPVLPMHLMPATVLRLGIQLGIIAVPAWAAQAVADAMVAAGIMAILNLAPARLSASQGVWLEHEDLASRLAALAYHVRRRAETEG